MPRDRVLLVVVRRSRDRKEFFREGFEELKELTRSAEGEVVGAVEVHLERPDPGRYLRSGKLAEIQEMALRQKANVLIFNVDLSPAQARNIEEEIGTRTVDRTGLILDIFARRAQSREGKLQVEAAQLNYLLPRLVGQGVLLSRLGGGIGTRGPGEQKLEVDRRRIRERIVRLKKDLERLEEHRARLREGRKRKDFSSVAIVGYTNVGKSTLLNRLTGARAFVEDKLFATLDPTTRLSSRNGSRSILFTDTVGFLRNLPHGLIEAFKATLEETAEADALVHVLDASHPEMQRQREAAEKVLEEIGAGGKPTVVALNKIDLVSIEERRRLETEHPENVLISAQEGLGLDELRSRLDKLLVSSLNEAQKGGGLR